MRVIMRGDGFRAIEGLGEVIEELDRVIEVAVDPLTEFNLFPLTRVTRN